MANEERQFSFSTRKTKLGEENIAFEKRRDLSTRTNAVIESGTIKPDYVPTPASGISRWTFDDADTDSGVAVDVWGSNDGTITGSVTTGVSGPTQTYDAGEAYEFNGGYVDFGTGTLKAIGPLTWAFWVNPNSTSGNQFLVANGYDSSTHPLHVRFSQGRLDVRNHDGSGYRVSTPPPSTDAWALVVVTADSNNNVGIYFNGDNLQNDGSLPTIADNGQKDTIGDTLENGSPLGNPYDGRMADTRQYGKVLTATEREDLYNTGSIVR